MFILFIFAFIVLHRKMCKIFYFQKYNGGVFLKKTKRSKLDSFFNISKYKSSVKIEVFAGITTFLAMAYILTVNPNNILWGGTSDPRFSSVFIATALGAVIGTLLMAFLAKTCPSTRYGT